jgi:hypothetical protein
MNIQQTHLNVDCDADAIDKCGAAAKSAGL